MHSLLESIFKLRLITAITVIITTYVNSQNKVYPDHYKENDSPFPHILTRANPTSYYFISARYFYSDNGDHKGIYIPKYGIIFKPYKISDGNLGGNLGDYFINQFKQKFYLDDTLKTDSLQNDRKSEMFPLISKIYYLSDAQFQSEIKYISKKSIQYTYRMPIYYEERLNFSFTSPLSIKDAQIQLDPPSEKFGYLEIIMSSPDGNSRNLRIQLKIGSIQTDVHSLEKSDSLREVTIKITGSVALSYYYLTLYKTSPESNTLAGDNPKSGADCVPGSYFENWKCLKCPSKCFECSSSSECLTCPPISLGLNGEAQNGQCVVNYIDITKFYDIHVTPAKAADTNRVTLGFWTLIDNYSTMSARNGIFHIELENYLIISIRSTGDQPQIYCSVQTQYNRNIISTTQGSALLTVIGDQNRYLTTTVAPDPNTYMGGRWFFTQCAMSYDQGLFYLNTIINNADNYQEKGIPHEYLYGDLENDDYYRHIKQAPNINIVNARNNSPTKIYLRNLVVFEEFIPFQIHYMYHDMSKDFMIGQNSVLVVLPFNELLSNNDQYRIKGIRTLNDEIDISPVERTFEFEVPLNFKQLPLLEGRHQEFEDVGLVESEELNTFPSGSASSAFGKPIFCNSDNTGEYYLFLNRDTQTYECTTQISGYTVYPGIKPPTGICVQHCPSVIECVPDYFNSYDKFCKANATNVYNLYYKCVRTTSDYYLFLSSAYNSQPYSLNIDQDLDLDSYIIEFWYYPDYGKDTYYALTIKAKNYIFYSDHMKVYFIDQNKKEFFYEGERVDKQVNFHLWEWNKITLVCRHEEGRFFLIGYVNNEISNPIDLGLVANCELTKILFNKGEHDEHWGSGYYKDLRIWNGKSASVYSTMEFEHFYTAPENMPESVIGYYPLKNQYIIKNLLTEITESTNDVTDWVFRDWNYGHKFDYAKEKGIGKYVSNVINHSPVLGSCSASGCARCWGTGSNDCYECLNGYYLRIRECVKIEKLFITLPAVSTDAAGGVTAFTFTSTAEIPKNQLTITFWIKIFGFRSGSENDVFRYSSKLGLMYENAKGLSLIYFKGQDDNFYLATDPKFKDKIGQWTFISFSYYRNTESIMKYFPFIMKFEINQETLEIKYPTNINDPDGAIYRKLETLEFLDRFSVPSAVFCKIYRFIVYSSFVSGAYGYETNTGTLPNPFQKPTLSGQILLPSTLREPCYTDPGFTVKCTPDNDPRFTSINNIENYLSYENDIASEKKCHPSCRNSCYGPSEEHCSCLMINVNSQMFVDNEGKHYCKKFDYINWANSNTTIENVSTAVGQSNPAYTLQFWIFAYDYVDGEMGNVTVNWEKHSYIRISIEHGYSCYPYYLENPPDDGEYFSINSTFNKGAWNFLSCAMNFGTQTLYSSTLDGGKSENFYKQSLLNGEMTSKLIITDERLNKEWGVLFFRQIRLWKEAYPSSDFLGRIKITKPSLFPGLLNAWEPTYNQDSLITDIAKKAKDTNVIHQGKLGMNKVNINDYTNIPPLCSENGQFFDKTSQSCLQFTDLSKMKDITFPNIPVSYSGNYAMSLWFFAEDYTNLQKGLHVQWTKHLQISFRSEIDGFKTYCFPTGYKYDKISNQNLQDKIQKGGTEIPMNYTSKYSEIKWKYYLCSVSNYLGIAKLNNDEIITRDLEKEVFYKLGNYTAKNVYPFRHFMATEGETSELKLENLANTKKLYFRSIQLFNDFIPETFDFKYMDLTYLNKNEMPSLLFVCNFAHFDLKDLNYTIFRQAKNSNNNAIESYKEIKSIKLELLSPSEFELSANFEFQPLCNPANKEYYNANQSLCAPYNGCERTEAIYCIDVNNHLACNEAEYINLGVGPNRNQSKCKTSCENSMRLPGTDMNKGLCNTELLPNIQNTIDLRNYTQSVNCKEELFRSDYHCYDRETVGNSALIYSRCHNPPNMYRTISSTTKQQIANGYYYEFWFMFDNVNNDCPIESNKKNEYYLYSLPHSIYKDENGRYYLSTHTKRQITESFNQYEWNQVVIKTVIGSEQYVEFYINSKFNKYEARFTGFSASSSLQLSSISFCAKKANGDCTAAGVLDITWGSAYYKDIRVWNLESTSLEVIQAKNNFIFSEYTTSLILYYPLTLDLIDVNQITEVISKTDSIISTHVATNNFYSEDAYLFYNFAVNFDYGGATPEHFINSMSNGVIQNGTCSSGCSRCYSTSLENCYNCTDVDRNVLINNRCEKGFYYLKTPIDESETSYTFQYNLRDTAQNGWTITFYLKFFGVSRMQSYNGATADVLSLGESYAVKYETATTNLIFTYQSAKFVDTQFGNYIGKWIPITITAFYSQDEKVFPNILTFAVNRRDIPFKEGFDSSGKGTIPQNIKLGGNIVALFSSFNFHSHCLQGIYGKMNLNTNNFETIALSSDAVGKCAENVFLSTNTPPCVKNYHDFESEEKNNKSICSDNQYLDPSLTEQEKPCGKCDKNACLSGCFDSNDKTCSCNLEYGLYWLRRKTGSLETYCEKIPNIDFAMLDDINLNEVPSSFNNESTIEVWAFVYSYNTTANKFTSIEIEWELHNKIKLYNDRGTLTVQCLSIFNSTDPEQPESITQTLTMYKWNLLRCGTDLASETKKFFLGSTEMNLRANKFPIRPQRTNFVIKSTVENPNFGFVFLREIKLWSQYNFKYIDTSYINLKTYEKFRGLLTYFKGINVQLPEDQTGNAEQSSIHLIEEISYTFSNETKLEFEGKLNRDLTRKDEFQAYNYVDPNNLGYYSLLPLCDEGLVYNSQTLSCVKPSKTKCEYPGDINDNCITCPPTKPYLFPEDGTCLSECPIGHYVSENINQCRKCHHSCYTCDHYNETSCLSCTTTQTYGKLMYVEKENGDRICVPNCEAYGLTMSITNPDVCCLFDAAGVLLNYNINEPIDNETFTELKVVIKNSTANGFTVKWGYDYVGTQELNPEERKNEFNDTSLPYNDNTILNDLNTETNITVLKIITEFFKVGTKYAMYIDVSKEKEGEVATKRLYFNIIINSPPVDGTLLIQPPLFGINNQTTFVISCNDWVDDTTKILQYSFWYHEVGTPNPIELRPWSTSNEIFTNFTVMRYQNPETNVTITCKIKDNYGIIAEIQSNITIVNSLKSASYSLDKALENYTLPNTTTPSMLLARSEFLKSLGLDTYKALQPELKQTKYEPALDQSIVTFKDPECTSDYCNGNGDCGLVDEFLVCYCKSNYVGRNCQLETTSITKLESYYKQLYDTLFNNFQSKLSYEEFSAVHNLYFAAHFFFSDPTFFSSTLTTFFSLAMNLFSESVLNNTAEYLDLIDYYYSYELIRLNKERGVNKFIAGVPDRNITLNENQLTEFNEAFPLILQTQLTFLKYIVSLYKTTPNTFKYESDNFYIVIAMVNPTFNDTAFFLDRKANYKSHIKFMECLNYIEIEKLSNPYYQAWMIYIEYLNFPLSYDESIAVNHTSPIIEIRFIDANTGKEITLNDCTNEKEIIITMPFTSYKWVSELNRQKWLYDPINYKSPDDSIFSDPIYINDNGFISNDTVEDRITKYNRLYNISCTFYDKENEKFSENGLTYKNFTSDSNYIVFTTSHLSFFATFFKENHMDFVIDSRFFYLKRPQLFKYVPNYTTNYAFYSMIALFAVMILFWVILGCYDYKKYNRQFILSQLKKEIMKQLIPYKKDDDKNVIAKTMVPHQFTEVVTDIGMLNNVKYKKKGKRGNKGKKFYRSRHVTDIDEEDSDGNSNNNNSSNNSNNSSNDDNVSDYNKETDIYNYKKDILTINKYDGNSNESESDKKDNTIEYENKFDLRKRRNFFNKQTVHNPFVFNINIVSNSNNNNNIHEGKFSDGDINTTDKDKHNKSIDNAEELQITKRKLFIDLNFTYCEFVCFNMRERNLFVTTFVNPSLFNPRWCKLILFTTEITLHMIMASVQLTMDENALIKTKADLLVKIAFLSMLATDGVMYLLAFFFLVPENQIRRLYTLVKDGGQLVVLKEYQAIKRRMCGFIFLGIVLCVCVWTFCFYICIGFVAVWSVQKLEWVVSVIITMFMDFVLFEIIFELIIGIFYAQRHKSEFCTKVCVVLNDLRNYRCLSQ